jgi:hypothetical protein
MCRRCPTPTDRVCSPTGTQQVALRATGAACHPISSWRPRSWRTAIVIASRFSTPSPIRPPCPPSLRFRHDRPVRRWRLRHRPGRRAVPKSRHPAPRLHRRGRPAFRPPGASLVARTAANAPRGPRRPQLPPRLRRPPRSQPDVASALRRPCASARAVLARDPRPPGLRIQALPQPCIPHLTLSPRRCCRGQLRYRQPRDRQPTHLRRRHCREPTR